MARSKESFSKKDVRTKQAKKRKEKEKRRLEKKEQGKSSSFDDMLAYVDENGTILTEPPDPAKREEVLAENIEVGIPKAGFRKSDSEKIRKGKVYNFNESKGYGFISDSKSNESIFVHVSDCNAEINNNDIVEFETEKGPQGLKAVRVKLLEK